MQEEFTTCGSCGRKVPRTQFCIYCGVKLSAGRNRREPESDPGNVFERVFETVEARTGPEAVGAPFFPSPYEGQQQEVTTTPAVDLRLDPEVSRLTEELTRFQIWKVRLCGMFMDGDVPGEVFASVYEDYYNRSEGLNERRTEIVSRYRSQYEEKRRELDAARLRLEELRVRVAVGELSESDRLIRTPEIKGDADHLEEEVVKLERVLEELGRLSTAASPREIFGYEQTAKRFLSSLGDLVSSRKVGEELGGVIRGDLEGVLEQLSRMYRGDDDSEASLRNELEELEVRYKVGEITLSEFESLREGIVGKLERRWGRSP